MASGRIMVLARKRDPLRWLADALAARQLPFVAPEDTLLRELPEAQDLLAVLDVLASPTQSLSLARALKSPLFGASDDDLLALAGRARDADGWWSALLPCADDAAAPQPLRRAARLLARWRDAACTLPPHDLLDRIVHEGELMPRLLAAVPTAVHARAQDAVRALLAAALTLDGARFATPYNFVRALRRRRIEAPRAAHPDAVQLLTIHGAKGLEAHVVFLMDAQPEARKGDRPGVLVEWPVDSPRPRRVAFLAAESRCPPSLRALMAEEHAAREREEVNALYVALTRAQASLVVSRTPPHAPGTATSWWQRLQAHAVTWTPEAPAPVGCAAGEVEVIDWPAAAAAAAPAGPATAEAEAEDTAAARLGRAVHRWLEWASADLAADRTALAEAAALACGASDASEVAAIGARILANPACRRFFEPAAIAWAGNEVPAASVEGEPRRIDRLVRLAGPAPEWWVLDYKLTASPQGDPALRAQLAAYRDAVARLAPGEPVRAAFVTGQGELVELQA
jgi:ATP-dependent helicase/nuclease subunit A